MLRKSKEVARDRRCPIFDTTTRLTVYFVNFGQVFHNDAVVQKLKESMCHED